MQSKARDPNPSCDHDHDHDHFDRIPDPILLVILNKLADVRSLGRCCSVSKRFSSLVPLVHDLSLNIDTVLALNPNSNPPSPKPRNLFSNLLRLVLSALRRSTAASNRLLSPSQALRNFNHVRSLRIELPSGDVGTEDGVFLKWRAEFGSTLQSCVILGGTRMDPKAAPFDPEDKGTIPESFYTNGGLKLRVVWTISSLIAASTRHYLLRPIVEDHPTLRSLVLTDADGQGTLTMGAEQLREFRERPAAAAAANRTQVPSSNMKLRYAPYLELPEGTGMQGATLVAIKPSYSSGESRGSGRREAEAFDGPFRAAVKALVKRRTYLLEMNGF